MSFLEDLPTELLRRILEYTLPQGLTFSFEQTGPARDGSLLWTTFAAPGKHVRTAIKNGSPYGYFDYCEQCNAKKCMHNDVAKDMHTALLNVNKHIASEARALFFRENTFHLFIDSNPHHPISLKSPLIFGPLGQPHRLHLLRDLRRIELTLELSQPNGLSITRLRARAQHFADVVNLHAGDAARKSLLESLRVHFRGGPRRLRCRRVRPPGPQLYYLVPERYMFALEPLALIQGIGDVAVCGVQEWFKQCLEMRMRGQGGELATVDWPTKVVKRRVKGARKAVRVEVCAREGWQPVFEWREFALRNGIALPEGIEGVFPAPCSEAQEV